MKNKQHKASFGKKINVEMLVVAHAHSLLPDVASHVSYLYRLRAVKFPARPCVR